MEKINFKRVGPTINFWSAESYKLLRTNLEFCFPDVTSCKVIGVTSAVKGEGKSTTAANLAYTIAQAGKKVLLVECDLRLPVFSSMMNLARKPGFTNLVVGTADGMDVLQPFDGLESLRVVTAGDIPPNPTELLSSKRVEKILSAMKEAADVVILDLPPVTIVPDALVLSKHVDGILLVVRQGYSTKKTVDEAIRQIEFSGKRILGFAMTDTKQKGKYYYDEYKAHTQTRKQKIY